MVKGINIFKEHFKDFKDNYRIIGGTACDIILAGQGFIPHGTNISIIDLDDDFSNLSVMVMDDEYYNFTLTNSAIVDDLYLASSESLICLKALAYQNLLKNKKEGKRVNDKDLSKHKNDVIRLGMLLNKTVINLPEIIQHDLEHFLLLLEEEKLDIHNILKHMQAESATLESLIASIRLKFNITVAK